MPTLIESGRVDQAEAQVQRPDGDAWPSSLARENIATLRPNTAWRHRRAATAIALMRATPDPSSALAVDQRRRVAFRLLVSLLCLNSREEVDRVLAAHGAVGWPARQVRVDVALAMNAGDCPRAKRLRRVTWVTWVMAYRFKILTK